MQGGGVIWTRLLIWLVLMAAGGAGGYALADWLAEDTRAELASLKAQIEVANATALGLTNLRKSEAAEARKVLVGLLDRLEHVRAARGPIYRERTRIIERLPDDRVCFNDADLGVLRDADRYAAAGPFAGNIDPSFITDNAASAEAVAGGSSVRAVGQWITDAMKRFDESREQINAFSTWARSVDGKCGCLKVE